MRSASSAAPGRAVPVGPERAEQDAGGAEGGVVEARVRGEPRRRSIHGCCQPSAVASSAAGRRRVRARGVQRDEDADGADEAVEVVVLRLVGDAAPDQRRRSRRPAPAPRRSRPGQPDLRQHVGEPADAAVHAVALLGRAAVVGHGSGIQGPSSQRTWSSTQRQAASPSSAYVSAVIRRSWHQTSAARAQWWVDPKIADLNMFASRVVFIMSVPLYQAKAEFFKTLGHPARIRILELLSERDHAVHELLEKIDIEPSNLSQQLAVLRRTSLVVSHRHGGEVVYSVSVRRSATCCSRPGSILSGIIAVAGRARGRADPRRAHVSAASPTPGRRRRWPRTGPAAARAASDWAACAADPDLTAGLMVGLVALPLALGFGVSSGMGAGAGLVTAIVAGAVAAVFGGSRVQVSGPTGAMTVVLVPDRRDPRTRRGAGRRPARRLILVGLGYAGAGRFIRYVPVPVVEGFTVGIAVDHRPAAGARRPRRRRARREGAGPGRPRRRAPGRPTPVWAPLAMAVGGRRR